MNKTVEEDINAFVNSFKLAKDIDGESILITGATGLIGSTLIHCLLAMNKNINITAPVRNAKKACIMFDKDELSRIRIIECNLTDIDYSQFHDIDYIVHCAAPTSSKYFIEHPVETFDIIYRGSAHLLEYAKNNPVKSFVFLSSLEVYGIVDDDSRAITEEIQGYLDPMAVRSSYPMAKRATENLCCLYANEYGVPVKIARLTQTTGAGIDKDDNRVIAQFARLASQGQDIVLHTTGESARPYCYITDAISAILYILLKGESGEVYNVANDETYISAYGMAEYLRNNFSPSINIRIELNDNMGYAPVTKHKLSTTKLQSLGWLPNYGLKEIFTRLIEYFSI